MPKIALDCFYIIAVFESNHSILMAQVMKNCFFLPLVFFQLFFCKLYLLYPNHPLCFCLNSISFGLLHSNHSVCLNLYSALFRLFHPDHLVCFRLDLVNFCLLYLRRINVANNMLTII